MVKLLASLLVLSFAMSSVLASSDKYQRRDIRNARVGITIPTSSDHFQSRGLDEDQDRFERDLDAEEFSVREYLLDARDNFDDLEARQPIILGGLHQIAGIIAKKNRIQEGLRRVMEIISASNHRRHIRSRSLEDNDDLSRRDLDAEEFFERDYDLLDERDTVDELD